MNWKELSVSSNFNWKVNLTILNLIRIKEMKKLIRFISILAVAVLMTLSGWDVITTNATVSPSTAEIIFSHGSRGFSQSDGFEVSMRILKTLKILNHESK